jgi:hypothetical protein
MKWAKNPSKFTFESKKGNFVRKVDRFMEVWGMISTPHASLKSRKM